MPAFDDLNGLNDWLRLRGEELASRAHPEQSARTITEAFEDERTELRALGRAFDGYVEKPVRGVVCGRVWNPTLGRVVFTSNKFSSLSQGCRERSRSWAWAHVWSES